MGGANNRYDGIEIISLTKGSSETLKQIKKMYGNIIDIIDTRNDGRQIYENQLVLKKGSVTLEGLKELEKLPDMTCFLLWLKESEDTNYSKIDEINTQIKGMKEIMSVTPVGYVFEEK
ncbi:Uncharacterised protein [uncultured archaeon]|nr:Uncharacterised protein [uncultured archaeon]